MKIRKENTLNKLVDKIVDGEGQHKIIDPTYRCIFLDVHKK